MTTQEVGSGLLAPSPPVLAPASSADGSMGVLPDADQVDSIQFAEPRRSTVTLYSTLGAVLGTGAGVGLGSAIVGDKKGFACANCGPMIVLGLGGNLAGASLGARVGAGRGPSIGDAFLGLVAGLLTSGIVRAAWDTDDSAANWVRGIFGLTVQGFFTADSALRR